MPADLKLVKLGIATERIANVNRLYAQGLPQTTIAKRLGISQHTVCEDIKTGREIWLATVKENRQSLVAAELEKLNAIEYEAFDQWNKSTKPAIEERTEEESGTAQNPTGKTKRAKTKRGRIGDSRLLAIIVKCIERRCALLGLDAPPQTASDVERDMAEPMVVEISTRDAAKLVMEQADGRLTVRVSDAPPQPIVEPSNVLTPSAIEDATVSRQPSGHPGSDEPI